MSFAHVPLLIGAVLYAVASFLFYLDVAQVSMRRTPTAPPEIVSRAPAILLAATLSHFVYITVASFVAHVCPINSVHFLLSSIAILASIAYLVARRAGAGRTPPPPSSRAPSTQDPPRRGATTQSRIQASTNLDALGLVVAPLGLAFMLGTYFLQAPITSSTLGPVFLTAHVLVNLLGIALFVLAGASAGLYLLHERRLKQKRNLTVGKLPPLATLDRAVHRFLLLGFPLLTIGIVTGTFWSRQLEFGEVDEIMRIVLGYATWLLIAAVLLLRVAAGWRGKRSAYGTILGVAFALGVLLVYLARPQVKKPEDGAAVSKTISGE